MIDINNLIDFGPIPPPPIPPKPGTRWPNKRAEVYKQCDIYVIRNSRNYKDILAECFFKFTFKRTIKRLEKQGWTIVARE